MSGDDQQRELYRRGRVMNGLPWLRGFVGVGGHPGPSQAHGKLGRNRKWLSHEWTTIFCCIYLVATQYDLCHIWISDPRLEPRRTTEMGTVAIVTLDARRTLVHGI